MKQNLNSYIEPEMEVVYLHCEDVITNSTEELPAWFSTEGTGF